MASFVSEYHEAKDRFISLTGCKRENDPLAKENKHLDDIIVKLCSKSSLVDTGKDAQMFYLVLLRSDYIQIKDELIETFYSQFCRVFLQKNVFYDIVKKLVFLQLIPQVKNSLARGLLDLCPFKPITRMSNTNLIFHTYYNKKDFTLRLHSNETITVNFSVVQENNHYRRKLVIRCLTILLRLYEFNRLKLEGFKLDEYNSVILSRGLQIKSLIMNNSGLYTNIFIQRNAVGLSKHLTELDLEDTYLETKTLEKIRMLPLKILNLSKCIWSCERIIVSTVNRNNKIVDIREKADVDVLWEGGRLRNTIEILNLSFNELTQTNLKGILSTQVTELNITKSFTVHGVDFSSIIFPKTLKVLKAMYNKTKSRDFFKVCNSSVKRVEIDIYEKEDVQELLQLVKMANVFEDYKVFDGEIHHYSDEFYEAPWD